MKKTLLFFIAALTIGLSTRAQQVLTSGEYWFDNSYNNRTAIPLSPSSFIHYNAGIDCSPLNTGLHVINFRFRQSNSQRSSTISQLFMKVPAAGSETEITACEYWIDYSYASRTIQPVTPGSTCILQQAIDYSAVATGIHTFNVRFKQSNGCWSTTSSQAFMKIPHPPAEGNLITAYEYWLDEDYQSKVRQQVTPADNLLLVNGLNLATIADGTHDLNMRFMQSDHTWSSTLTQTFVKVPLTIDSRMITAYEFWFDNLYNMKVHEEIAPAGQCFITQSINTDDLSIGIHSFNIRFLQNDGAWSGTTSQMFMKQVVSSEENVITNYEYWFNDHFENRILTNTPPADTYTAINNLDIGNSDRFLNIYHARFRDHRNNFNYIDEYYYALNLDLTIFLESLNSATSGLMRKAQNEAGDNFPGTIADTISIQIKEAMPPYNTLLDMRGLELNTDGSCQVTRYGSELVNLPNSSNTMYYIVVRHRNSIETWSQAVSLEPLSAYNFSTSLASAFGGNLIFQNGLYMIYGGDVTQDGTVDAADMTPVDNASAGYVTGYIDSDVNGDGVVDTADMIIVDNNSAGYVGSVTP